MSRRRSPGALVVLLNGSVVGTVEQAGGKLTFTYEESWRTAGPGIPLSLSIPLMEQRHPHAAIAPFMWGLLPDNQAVLNRWGGKFGVSANNPFALLAAVGEDCAGAVQFALPERLAEMESGGSIVPIDERELGRRLSELRHDAAAGRQANDNGQFSLAGAQAKTAFHLSDAGWGIPSGRIPTTHIFKPPLADLAGHIHNEHFCLRLAAEARLPAASTEVMTFAGEVAIVVERYDRARVGEATVRVHQEDFCQSLGVHPALKYENDGGPGVKRIMELLDSSSNAQVDKDRFVRSLAFNFAIGGTDAHAKNFSVLFGRGGTVRLAPLYDVASVLPWPDQFPVRRLKMPMRIGREYRLAMIQPRHWARMATEVGYPADAALAHVRDLIERLPDEAAKVAASCEAAGAGHQILPRLVDAIAARCRELAGTYGHETAPVGSAEADQFDETVGPRRGL